jgi:hypothetical protein
LAHSSASKYILTPIAMFFNRKNWVKARVTGIIQDIIKGVNGKNFEEKKKEISKVFDLLMLSIEWNAPDIKICLLTLCLINVS